jgi:hypothetical protein
VIVYITKNSKNPKKNYQCSFLDEVSEENLYRDEFYGKEEESTRIK